MIILLMNLASIKGNTGVYTGHETGRLEFWDTFYYTGHKLGPVIYIKYSDPKVLPLQCPGLSVGFIQEMHFKPCENLERRVALSDHGEGFLPPA